ncbi:hypothetical protein V5O48_009694 [Marasmius crinis-equi]|uniref:Uncharacterized protein n=1 Tax=Marasmius crinis-equi TaxID=585013 RepID=A0ABR3FAD1_9AGAR
MTTSTHYVFCYPKLLGEYRATTKSPAAVSGVYESVIFVPGGKQQAPFPIVFAAPSALSHPAQSLLQPEIDELGTKGPSAVISALQSSSRFQSVCELMDSSIKFYYAMITAKSVLIHYSRDAADGIWRQTTLQNPYMQIHSSFKGAFFAMVTKGSAPSFDLVGKSFDDLDHFVMALEAPEPTCRLTPLSAPSTPHRSFPRAVVAAISPSPARSSKAKAIPTSGSPIPARKTPIDAGADDSSLWEHFELGSQELASAVLSAPTSPAPSTSRDIEKLELELSRFGDLVRQYFELVSWQPKQSLTAIHVFDASNHSGDTFVTMLRLAYPAVSIKEARFVHVLLACQKEID